MAQPTLKDPIVQRARRDFVNVLWASMEELLTKYAADNGLRFSEREIEEAIRILVKED